LPRLSTVSFKQPRFVLLEWLPEICSVCKDFSYSRISGATERHVFVLVAFGGAPFSVEYYLAGELEPVPVQAPQLPSPVTAVWIMSFIGQYGLFWDGVAWQRVSTEIGQIEDPKKGR
jgi:hypothetical protein